MAGPAQFLFVARLFQRAIFYMRFPYFSKGDPFYAFGTRRKVS